MIESSLEQDGQAGSSKTSLSSEIYEYFMKEIEEINKELDKLLFSRSKEKIKTSRSFLDKFKIWRKKTP